MRTTFNSDIFTLKYSAVFIFYFGPQSKVFWGYSWMWLGNHYARNASDQE